MNVVEMDIVFPTNFLFKIIIQSQTGKANTVWEALEVVKMKL